VPELERPGGIRIHYAIEGESGPHVLLASYWSWNPTVYANLLGDLASDHRVVTYHLRGCGESSRSGPYEMETDAGDLEALVEALEAPLVLIGVADSANRAAEVGARMPDGVTAVICFGAAPFARASFEGKEAMLGSESVVGALVEMLEHNYRGAMRTIMEATNPQMDEDELRDRVDMQVEFCPAEAALGRLKAWVEDDPREASKRLGDRLWIFAASGVAGPWLPPKEEMDRLIAETMPAANVVEAEPGPISAPGLIAEKIRKVAEPLRSGAAADRK
jgi:pimeloyl-ACP methyl ester carboxylesterase